MDEEIGTVGGVSIDDEPVTLTFGSSGGVAALPTRVRRLPDDALAVVTDIQTLVVERQGVDRLIAAQVEEARFMGVSWSIIAWSLGMSEAGAKRRYGAE